MLILTGLRPPGGCCFRTVSQRFSLHFCSPFAPVFRRAPQLAGHSDERSPPCRVRLSFTRVREAPPANVDVIEGKGEDFLTKAVNGKGLLEIVRVFGRCFQLS